MQKRHERNLYGGYRRYVNVHYLEINDCVTFVFMVLFQNQRLDVSVLGICPKVILTNQKCALIVFSAQITRNVHVNSQERPRIGWNSAKQKNTLAQQVLDIISDVRARYYETIC